MTVYWFSMFNCYIKAEVFVVSRSSLSKVRFFAFLLVARLLTSLRREFWSV